MDKPAQTHAHSILGWFDGRTHKYPIHVFYEDTDFSGIVYYANYLKFFERGRSSFLNLVGIEHAKIWDEQDMAFTVRKFAIEYKAPARVDDQLIIHTTYDVIKGARMLITQSCYLGQVPIITADCEAVCITSAGKPIRAPEFLKTKLGPYLLKA